MGFDAAMVLSFGGPERPDDVMPFLQNVVRGRPVPPARLEVVAQQYMQFGGRSPINEQNRALVDAVRSALAQRDHELPVYFGNRNWHPFLSDTLEEMRGDGVKRAAVFVTSAYSSFSGCRQYLDDMVQARLMVGPGAPELVKLRPYFDRPGFVGPLAAGLRDALTVVSDDTPVVMTAHSIPLTQADHCDYQSQLRQVAGAVASQAGLDSRRWTLAFQSRSGPPAQPWLEPDISDLIAGLPDGTRELIVVPIGFVSDHMEVVYDLDHLAHANAEARRIKLIRTTTPGIHPDFIDMICDLILEAESSPTLCPPGCCQPPSR